MDLTLTWNGTPLALGTAFDAFKPEAALHALESVESVDRELRRILAGALLSAGLVPYELEWWHWSYGDDVWAAAKGRDALYEIAPSP